MGISRSAFYKYKDCVFSYEPQDSHRLCTIHLTLLDQPGVFLGMLSRLYALGVNILTLNQNMPVDGVANVSVTARVGWELTGESIEQALLQDDKIVEAHVVTQ